MGTLRLFQHSVPICISTALALLLAACAPGQTPPALPPVIPTPAGSSTPDLFVPVPPSPTIPAPATETALPAVTVEAPACSPNLTYLSDLTLPDNSIVAPGEALDKRWQVQNSGTCDWEMHYRLRLISGTAMGVQEQTLYPARAGTEALLQMDLTAPQEPGWYTATWQAFAPDGSPFGEVIIIAIIVQHP